MEIVNALVGIIQLVIAIILAVVALYIGFSVFGKITKGIEEEKEIQKGNTAIGVVAASLFIAIGIVVQSGISGISTGISQALKAGLLSSTGIVIILVAIFQLILGVVLAIGSIYLALNILDKLTEGIDEFGELKKGNVAVALEMGGVIITVAIIIQSGITGLSATLI